MEGLTKKQAVCLKKIKAYIAKNGYPPAIADISAAMGRDGKNAALGHIKALQRKGKIKYTRGVARSIIVLEDE